MFFQILAFSFQTIAFNGFSMVFESFNHLVQWFSMVTGHWSNDAMVSMDRSPLVHIWIFYYQLVSAKILTDKLLTCKKRQFAAIGCWTVGFPELNASVCGGQCAFRVSGFVGGCRGEGRVYFRNLPLYERPVFFSHTRSHTVQAWQRCHAQTMDWGLGKILISKCPRTRTIMHTEILFTALSARFRIISIYWRFSLLAKSWFKTSFNNDFLRK